MKLEHQIKTDPKGLKVQSFKHLADFVKYALRSNGRDYETIRQRMTTVAKFADITKHHGIKKDLSKVKEIYQDLFIGDRLIDRTPSSPNQHQHVATYEKIKKGGVVKCSVSLHKSAGEFGSIICFHEDSRAKELFTTIHFTDENLFFLSESNSKLGQAAVTKSQKSCAPIFEECRINFNFDKTHHLTKVDYLRKFDVNGKIANESETIDLSRLRTQTEIGMTK